MDLISFLSSLELGPLPDLYILVILFGVFITYFGKIIASMQAEEHSKFDYRLEGLIFTLFYLIIPSFIAFAISKIISFPSPFGIFAQIIFISLLYFNSNLNRLFKRLQLSEEFKIRLKERDEKIRENSEFYRKSIEISALPGNFENVDKFVYKTFSSFRKIFSNQKVLFLISSCSIFFSLEAFGESLIYTFSSGILTFLVLTLISLSYSFSKAYYPPAEIKLEDGETLKGRIIKFGKYVNLRSEDKKLFINKDKIKYIEESIWKEEE